MDFEVELKGGAPWGFRIQGGKEFHSTIKITFLKPGGKAAKSQGIRIGDMLVHINDVATAALTHTQAEMQIKRAGSELKLSLHRKVPPKPEPVPQAAPSEDAVNADGSEDKKIAPPITPRRRTASVPARPETTKTVSDKEKDPDWYKSMFKTVHQGVELKATPMGGEEVVTRAPVKKKASVYEMEVQKTNNYNYERSRRPSRQSLTGRPTPSLSVLALGKSHEDGAPVRQYADCVFEGSSEGSDSGSRRGSLPSGSGSRKGSLSGSLGSRKGSEGSVIEEVQDVVELEKDEGFKRPMPMRRATEGSRPMIYSKPIRKDVVDKNDLGGLVSSEGESVKSHESDEKQFVMDEKKESIDMGKPCVGLEMPELAEFLGVPSVSNLAAASQLLGSEAVGVDKSYESVVSSSLSEPVNSWVFQPNLPSVNKSELLGEEISSGSEEEVTLSEPVKPTAEEVPEPAEIVEEVTLGTEIVEKETVIEVVERELEILDEVESKKEVSVEDEENKENLKPEPKAEEKLSSTPIKEVDDSDLSDGEIVINTLSITDPDHSDHSLPEEATLSGVIPRCDMKNDLVLLSAITSPPKSDGVIAIPKEQIPEFV